MDRLVQRYGKRILLLVLGIVAWRVYQADFWQANRFREPIRAAIERALGRRVEVQGDLAYSFLKGPGFIVEKVIVHEDPAHGLEPFAYVTSLEARLNVWRLFTGHVEFGTLRLDEPSLNLSRQADHGANLTPLIQRALSSRADAGLPDVQVRNGRVNFVFNRRKSVFYLTGVDLDLTPIERTGFRVRFAGEPARTDRRALGFGRFAATGSIRFNGSAEPEVDLSLDLDRTSAAEVATLFERRANHLTGRISTAARLRGPISEIAIAGKLTLEPSRRELNPLRQSGLPLAYHGKLDLRGQTLRLDSLPADNPTLPALALRFRSREILRDPRWAALFTLRQQEIQPVVGFLRSFGYELPEPTSFGGTVSGTFGLSMGGYEGMAVYERLAESETVNNASLLVDGPRVVFETGFRDLAVEQFRGAFNSLFGAWAPGFVTDISQGKLTGNLRFDLEGEKGAWSGTFRTTPRLKLDGLLEPVETEALTVELAAGRMTVPQFHGRVGGVSFDASYRYEPGVTIPHLFSLTLPTLDLGEAQRLFAPTLARQSTMARTFGLANGAVPEWLARRQAEGTVRVGSLIWNGKSYPNVRARVRWQGANVEIDNIELASGRGSVKIDLSGGVPVYDVAGTLPRED
ncbi:MAG: AsmA family protein [Bryobacteraceae bacterium]|nr:AsmA family protein [Bryobacteraceae bacterium]